MRFLKALAVLLALASPAAATSAYMLGPTISTTTGRVTESIAGTLNMSASSTTISTPTIILAGINGGINASSVTLVYGIKSATASIGGAAFNVSGGHVSVGSLTPATTVAFDVVGLIRTTSGYITVGGNARGTFATDLQVYRTAGGQVASGAESVIGGGGENISAGSFSTIAGGSSSTITSVGDYSGICSGYKNSVAAAQSFIGGGSQNVIGSNTGDAVICGGLQNSLDDVSDPTYPSAIAGGKANSANNASFVGGGHNNSASYTSTIGGGSTNSASNNFATVSGGDTNTGSGADSAIGGGATNVAAGQYSTVPGGLSNKAYGISSFAAGRKAVSSADGSVTFADYTADAVFNNGSTDTFKTRFAGGYALTGGVVSLSSAVVMGLAPTVSTVTATGFYVPRSMTKAQIAAYTPATAELGGIIGCSDCASPYSVCQATGTVLMGLRLGVTGTTQCQ